MQVSLSVISKDTIISEVDGLEDTASEGMRQRLFDLELQEKELDSRFTDNHPKLAAVRQQLAEVNLLLVKNTQSRQEVTLGLNPSHNNVSLQLLTEKASEASTEQRLNELLSQHQLLLEELKQLNLQESVMNDLTRKHVVLKTRYQAHSVKREQAPSQ